MDKVEPYSISLRIESEKYNPTTYFVNIDPHLKDAQKIFKSLIVNHNPYPENGELILKITSQSQEALNYLTTILGRSGLFKFIEPVRENGGNNDCR